MKAWQFRCNVRLPYGSYPDQAGVLAPGTVGAARYYAPFYGNGAYQPAVPAFPVDDGGAVAGGAQTAPGAALQGVAQVVGAAGQQDLAASTAAVNATQAQSNALQNDVRNVQTFWAMCNIGRTQRAGEIEPRPASEELAATALGRAQPALTASQIDPLTGALYWPGPLRYSRYDTPRRAVDQYAAKWAQYGGLDFADREGMRKTINAMLDALKSEIGDMPPQEYLKSRSFLQSLLQATTRDVT